MPNVAVIEDATVLRMINDDTLSAAIPCLYAKKTLFKNIGNGGCGTCSRKRAANRRTDVNQIKICLAGLSQEKRNTLKNWLGAETARVMYTNTAGQVVQVNF
jgi:hypothetical protein